MDANTIKNRLEKALKKNEILRFSLGDGEYFIADREYGGHWVYGSWKNDVLPYLEANNSDPKVIQLIFSELVKHASQEASKCIHILLYHYYVFLYLKKEKKLIGAPFIKSIESEIAQIVIKVKNDLSSNQEELSKIETAINSIKNVGGFELSSFV